MKVSFDEYNYYLPEYEHVLVINESDDSLRLLRKLNEYFGKKKKSVCKVVSDDNQKYLVDDFEFVYVPWQSSIEANYEFKLKTLFNDYLTNEIKNNEDAFGSIEMIRNNLRNLMTDKGMYSLYKYLMNGINNHVTFSINNFDIASIISNLEIVFENDNYLDQYLGVYNIAFQMHRDKLLLVYVDAPINDTVQLWLNKISTSNQILILNGEFFSEKIYTNLNYYICNNSLNCHCDEIELDEFINLQYVFNPFVLRNIRFQNQNIVDLYRQFDDKNTSFLLKVNVPETLNSR